MRIAIIEDLPSDRAQLAEDISRWAKGQNLPLVPPPDLFDSGEALLAEFSKGKYDILFLDIYMDGINGMETARRIRETDQECRLVFTTTTAEFAVDSYEVDSSWYLVKPYSFEKLAQALERCGTLSLEQGQSLVISGKNGEERLLLHQIAWTEYTNRRICIHFKDNQEALISMKQTEFSSMLLKYPYFCDCMKGIIVNLEAVEKLLDDCILLQSGQILPVSRLKYRQVREQFLEYSYAKMRKTFRHF